MHPYPDECLYSIIARYHVRSTNPSFSMTLQDLFPGARKKSIGVASAITMPSHLTQIDHWADTKSGFTVDSVAKAHTAIQLYAIRATANPNHISKGIWRQHAHQLTLLHPDRYLRYCPCCAQEQIKVYGEAYWQRLPQLRGAEYCPFHEVPYVSSAIPVTSAGKHPYTATYALSLAQSASQTYTSQSRNEPRVKRSYVALSKDLNWLLANGCTLSGLNRTYRTVEAALCLKRKGLYGRTIEQYALDVYPENVVYDIFPSFRHESTSYNAYMLYNIKPAQLAMLMSVACGSSASFAEKRKNIYPKDFYASLI